MTNTDLLQISNVSPRTQRVSTGDTEWCGAVL